MKKYYLKIFILVLSLFLTSLSFSGLKNHINNSGISQEDDWKIKRTKVFKANDLYGHIDGGAELFLEVGFTQLTVNYYVKEKSELTLEIYEMESPESALAIYLFKCGKETPIKEVKARNTGDKFQIMAIKGNCYIAINNPKGSKDLPKDMAKLLNKDLKEIPDRKPADLFSILPAKYLPNTRLLIRGMYSLQTIYTFGEGDVLQLNGNLFGAAADYKDKDGKVYTRILVNYPAKEFAGKAFACLLNSLDSTKKIISKAPDNFIFMDHSKKYGIAKISNKLIDIRINLLKEPDRP
jgi:hypothetical protein